MSEKRDVTPLRLAEIKAPKRSGSNLTLPLRPKVQGPIVRSLEEQAAEVMRQARERASQVEKEAYEQGYAQGEKDGRTMGEKRFEATAQGLRLLCGELTNLRTSLLREAEEELVRLALDLARAVIRAEVSGGPEVALRSLREALASMAEEAAVTVRLNPADLDCLKGQGLLPEGARFEPDPKIAPGGCVAESERERFDARVERQLERLEEALRQEMSRSGAAAEGEAG